MKNPTQVKRKHFRFPAYDDEIGVKLPATNKRNLFEDEQMLNQVKSSMSNTNQNESPIIDPVGFKTEMQPMETNKQHKNHSKQQVKELAKHKSNLPDYTASWSAASPTKKKANLFGPTYKKNPNVYRDKNKNQIAQNYNSKPYKYEDHSYFVPKYIPASVIPDEPKSSASEQELANSMKKEKNSYLLFDEEPTAFQIKSEKDPTVKKFNIPKETPDIPVTRRQYQQIKPDMERFGSSDISHTLPRSRKELKSAKENAKSQTAYGQKIAEAEQEKKT